MGGLILNLKNLAIRFSYAVGYEEKSMIIREVAKTMGRSGIVEFATMIDRKPEELYKYAALSSFFEDRNRKRRKRKPKNRHTAAEQIAPIIYKELQCWGYK